jgi:hypothetical protein
MVIADPYFESVSSDGMYQIDRYKKPVMTQKKWKEQHPPRLSTTSLADVMKTTMPQPKLRREPIPMPEKDMSGKIKPPQSVTIQKTLPDGTPYTVQRPVKPQYLDSQKIGFYQDGGPTYADSLALYNQSKYIKSFMDDKGVVHSWDGYDPDKYGNMGEIVDRSGIKPTGWTNFSFQGNDIRKGEAGLANYPKPKGKPKPKIC